MKTTLALAIAVSLLAACGGEPAGPTAAEALEEASSAGKSLVLSFSREGCPPCDRMKTEVWPDPDLAKVLEGYAFVEVDAEKDREASGKYEVSLVPQVLLVAPDGTVEERMVGFRSAKDLIRVLGTR